MRETLPRPVKGAKLPPQETREQRHERDRINTEAAGVIKSLQDQFMNFFMEAEDPEGNEVVEKMKVIDAKWRVYCKRRNLIGKAYPVMNEFMEAALQEYLAEKQGKNEEEGTEEGGAPGQV
jgi:hypothetical protein